VSDRRTRCDAADVAQTIRHDRGLAALRAPQRTAGGAVVYEARVARVHDAASPLRYVTGDEYRDASELESIARQARGLAVIVQHPEGDRLLAEAPEKTPVGHVLSARVDGDHVVVEFAVTHDDGLTAIRQGMRELSLGYTTKLDAGRYQRGITLDHLALVPRARCGPTCELRADHARKDAMNKCPKCGSMLAADATECPKCGEKIAANADAMPECPECGADCVPGKPCPECGEDVPADASKGDAASCPCKKQDACHAQGASESRKDTLMTPDEIKKLQETAAADKARADQAERCRDEQRARADAAETQRRAYADAAKTALEAAVAQARTDAADRIGVETVGQAVLGPVDGSARKFDGVDTLAIKRDVIKAVLKIDVADGEPEPYVRGLYTAAVKAFDAGQTGAAKVRQALGTTEHARGDAASNEATATATLKTHLANAHKGS
jgi:ribosomal protein L32